MRQLRKSDRGSQSGGQAFSLGERLSEWRWISSRRVHPRGLKSGAFWPILPDMFRVCGTILVLALALVVFGCATVRPPYRTPTKEQRMAVTGYCKCGDCCGWRRNWYGMPVYAGGSKEGQRKQVGLTASGRMASEGTIAADTRLYPFGTVMYIEGYGYGRVEDTGGRVKGQHIDLYFHSHREARRWGQQKKVVKVWMPAPSATR